LKCGGSGIYTERYVELDVYNLDNFEFHIPTVPVGRNFDPSLYRKIIEGYVIHKGVTYYDSYNAMMLLTLIMGDYRRFFSLFTASVNHVSVKNFLVTLATIYGKTFGKLLRNIRLTKHFLKNRLFLLKQVLCKHSYIQNKYACSKCGFSNPDNDDIPF
jgi:hypothetical protein